MDGTSGVQTQVGNKRSIGMEKDFSGAKRQHFDTEAAPNSHKTSNITNFASSTIVEEFPDYGVRALIDKYITSKMGQLSIINTNNKKTDQVLFHVNQVWAMHAF